MSIEHAYHLLYLGALIVLAVLIGIMLIRAVIGPRITDRILAVNMLGTMVISSIAILSRYLGEGYLVDVALIYAMISFVAVIMLATTYLSASPRQPRFPGEGETPKRNRRRALKTGESGENNDTEPERKSPEREEAAT